MKHVADQDLSVDKDGADLFVGVRLACSSDGPWYANLYGDIGGKRAKWPSVRRREGKGGGEVACGPVNRTGDEGRHDAAHVCTRWAALVFVALCCPYSSLYADSGEMTQGARTKPESTGIDPTEIVGRYAINYAYVEKDNGTTRHNLGLGFEKDLTKSVKAGITVPLTYAETVDGGEEQGLGDMRVGGGWRFYHEEQFSALLSVRGVLDTSSDETLGDGNYKLTTGLVVSWRKSEWLLSLSGGWTLSEDSEQNDVSISPLLGYQPMAKYLSYITVGPSYSYGLESKEDALGVTAFMGKVMRNKDVLALGTQYNLEGVDENKAFVLASWKRLF